ncbi:MAG: hypothetical protein HYY40_08425 [Bacteroidetes bacterium]|nr:hypothetical protein [Bacteroidota bacterium]
MKKITLFLFLILFFGLSSCKRYDEGPRVSMRSPEWRLVGSKGEWRGWALDKATLNDSLINCGGQFHSQGGCLGDCLWIYPEELFWQFGCLSDSITRSQWKFKNHKKEIEITRENGEIITWHILRLKRDECFPEPTDEYNHWHGELWVKEYRNDGELMMYFKSPLDC